MYKNADPKFIYQTKSILLKRLYRIYKFGLRYWFDKDFHRRKVSQIHKANKHEHRNINQTKYRNTTYRVKKRILGERKYGFCMHCKHSFPKDQLSIDHIIPISEGGTNKKENLQMLCMKCHLEKDLAEKFGNYPFREALKKSH